MFFVITKRVVKSNTGSTEKFAPRTANNQSWHVSGPFSKRALAERAAVLAMGTHTCLVAQVLSSEQLADFSSSDYGLDQTVRNAKKYLLPSDAVESQ